MPTSTEPDLTVSTSTTEAVLKIIEEPEEVEKIKEESEEVKEDEEEATSTELLLVPLMATKEDHSLTSLAQLAEYVKVRMTKLRLYQTPRYWTVIRIGLLIKLDPVPCVKKHTSSNQSNQDPKDRP